MPYAFVATGGNSAVAAATSIAVASVTLVAGEGVAVLVEFDRSTAGAVTVADTLGNTYTQQAQFLDTSGTHVVYTLFTCSVATGGSTTITATLPSSVANRCIDYWRWTGLSGAIQVLTANSQNPGPTTTGGITTGSVVPAGQPAMVFGVASDYTGTSGATMSADTGAGFTARGARASDATVGTISQAEDMRITATASFAATFTLGVAASEQVVSLGLIWQESGGADVLMPQNMY